MSTEDDIAATRRDPEADALSLIAGYGDRAHVDAPPQMSLWRMAVLGWRTWPYMWPMRWHLVTLLALTGAAMLTGVLGFFVGVDLFNNKVLVGEGLQPIQAKVLFVGDEYVTTDPQKLGKLRTKSATKGKGKGKAPATASAGEAEDEPSGLVGQEQDAAAAEDASDGPELTREQRRTVRNRLVLWGIAGGVFGALFGGAFWYYSMWIWQCINQNLRVAMIERAESLSLRYHDNNRVGDAIFRVYQDSAMIVNLIQSAILAPAMMLFGLASGVVIVGAFDPWFALLVLVVGIPIGWVIVKSTPRIRRRALANRIANSRLTSRIQEAFGAIKVVKANRAERRIFRQFDEDSRQALNAAYFLRLDMALATLVVAVLGTGMMIVSEYIMVAFVIENRETFAGALVAGLVGFVVWNYGAVDIARGQVGELSGRGRGLLGIWMRMQDLFIALERAFFLLDLEPEVTDPADPVPFPTPIENVAWRDVHFGYDTDAEVLRGVDFETRSGTVTAIVGGTGAGKSTLMTLLLRLYDPAAGTVSVNGVDLKDLAVSDLRAHVGIALQKNVLFAATVADNIAFGTANADRAAIEAAARVACADEFILDMADGYDTELGERGGKLSSGQRQRLSIARAVVRDTPVLVLDEPTASLDARTEQRLLSNLAEWGRGRVIFLITHRLSTIRDADAIALIEDGRIAEHGTHDELMARVDGRYRAFVEAETVGNTIT
ncbi:MAG: ABC transporter ATP-binding protein [Gammaproteobacteria bacterium]|nr:ABC transporter ATP-binding protein [Gammaproteobacteria bacterium]